MNYIPLNCKTHYSVRQAISKPKDILQRLKLLNIDTCAITDMNNISGAVQFKNTITNGIIGTEVCDLDGCSYLLYAKNFDGWKKLIKITSTIHNSKDECIDKNLLITLLDSNVAVVYLFPENNPLPGSFYGVNLNSDNYAEVRDAAKSKKMPTIAVNSSKYSSIEDFEDYVILLSIAHNISSNLVPDYFPEYYSGKKFHILSYDEAIDYGYTEEELNNTLKLNIENFTLKQNPILPKFDKNIDSSQLLREICEKQLQGKSNKYKEQLDYELGIINKYNLADYFLIVKDIIDFVNKNYGMCGIRGSGAGCVISYLAGITEVDPLEYNLYFERFINPGRMSTTHIQLPDIDIDVPADAREHVIDYIKNKYGQSKTGQILTYQRIKTHAALKAVFRSTNKLSFDEVNQITKLIPEEAKVADKLKELDYSSLLLYAIETKPDEFRQWVHINEHDEIDGEFKNEFKQAMRLEGLNSAKSKHAAGIVISEFDLDSICPMIWDHSSNRQICGMEMNDLESIGCMKLDILGLRLFDKLIEIFW